MKLKTLLKKATTDPKALAELRQHIPAGVTVFVPGDDGIDVDATCAAFEYWKRHKCSPVEWGEDDDSQDILTIDIAKAFPERRRLNPLTMQPITPGLWSRLWDSKSGHERVAALWWGKRTGAIRDSDTQIKLNARMLLTNGDWPLLRQCIIDMNRSVEARRQAMEAVYPAVQSARSAPRQTPMRGDQARQAGNCHPDVAPLSSVAQGTRAALLDLERQHRTGMIDIGRYLPLKAGLVEKLVSDPTVLRGVILTGFNLEEIRTLCFNLGVEYDDLGGQGISAKARELAVWAQRHRRTGDLMNAINVANPAAWGRYLSE